MKYSKKILGLPIICIEKNIDSKTMQIFGGLIKGIKTPEEIKWRIFGIQISQKLIIESINNNLIMINNKLDSVGIKISYQDNMLRLIESKVDYSDIKLNQRLNELETRINEIKNNMPVLIKALGMHREIFSKYRQIHEGKEIVLLACGPTASKYEPIEGAIHVGVNNAIKFEKIKLDYLFLTDFFLDDEEINKNIDKYVGNDCKKFYAVIPNERLKYVSEEMNIDRIPQSNIFNANAYPFFLEDIVGNNWATELAYEPFGDFGGSVFSALQFILYTHPKRVYLVGCDCTDGYFYESSSTGDNRLKLEGFKQFAEFAERIYPDIEIVSINPESLKGLFKDIYIN